MEQIYFDSKDWKGMIELMDKYGDSESPYPGQTENGERTNLSINHDSIVLEVYQDNGWVRQNWYWRDGTTEETFEGRWK